MYRLLDQSIRQRRDAKCPDPALRLGDVHPAYWLGHEIPDQQARFDLRPVLLQVGFEFGNANTIDSGTAFVLDHPLIREHQVASLDDSFH